MLLIYIKKGSGTSIDTWGTQSRTVLKTDTCDPIVSLNDHLERNTSFQCNRGSVMTMNLTFARWYIWGRRSNSLAMSNKKIQRISPSSYASLILPPKRSTFIMQDHFGLKSCCLSSWIPILVEKFIFFTLTMCSSFLQRIKLELIGRQLGRIYLSQPFYTPKYVVYTKRSRCVQQT